MLPERANIHTADFGSVDHFSEGPHKGAIDTHELLGVDLIGFVEQDPDFVLVDAEGIHHNTELVGNVELVGVKHDDDEVGPVGEPLNDSLETGGRNTGKKRGGHDCVS